MGRTTAVLYSTAVCNLDCTYCYINKNKGLKAIDRLLADSFADPDYYFGFIRDYFPHKGEFAEAGNLGRRDLPAYGAGTQCTAQAHRPLPIFQELLRLHQLLLPGVDGQSFRPLRAVRRVCPQAVRRDPAALPGRPKGDNRQHQGGRGH